MKRWVEFDKVTGRIGQSISGTDGLVVPDETETLGRLDDVDPISGVDFYVAPDTRQVLARPPSTISGVLNANVLTLSGVAVRTTVEISGDATASVVQDALDGHLELTFSVPGTYRVDAEQFPEQPFSGTYTI